MSDGDWDARYEQTRKSEIVRGILDRCIPRFPIVEQKIIVRTKAIAMNLSNWKELPLLWVAFALLEGGQWPNEYRRKLADVFTHGSESVDKDAGLAAYWDWKYGLSLAQERDDINLFDWPLQGGSKMLQ